MSQLGIVLSENDVHAMMKSVGIGPYGKISYAGASLFTRISPPSSLRIVRRGHSVSVFFVFVPRTPEARYVILQGGPKK